jgi:hypothetical protein
METKALLRAIYRMTLTSKTLEEAQNAVSTMMDEEDVAYVEKKVSALANGGTRGGSEESLSDL